MHSVAIAQQKIATTVTGTAIVRSCAAPILEVTRRSSVRHPIGYESVFAMGCGTIEQSGVLQRFVFDVVVGVGVRKNGLLGLLMPREVLRLRERDNR